MKIVIARDQQLYGPYLAGSLREMVHSGRVLPTDKVRAEDSSEWLPVQDFLRSCPGTSPPPGFSTVPPPLPQSPPRILAAVAPVAASVPPLLPGISELEQQVMEGGRFVIFQYCISILILTFKRPSEIVFLKRDQDGFNQAMNYSLLSVVFGWWGIPWGPIWTISSLVRNGSGGLDVTREVLVGKVGPVRAADIMARRPAPAAPRLRLKLIPWVFISAPVVVVMAFLLSVVWLGSSSSASRNRAPGAVQFEAANRQIALYEGREALGNSPAAVSIASQVSASMARQRSVAFEGGNASGLSLSGHRFLTYCELRDNHCVLLIHVPELRRFTDAAKVQLGEMAWSVAQSALKSDGAGRTGMDLVVGVRGITLYDRVLFGKYQSQASDANTGITRIAKGADSKDLLPAYFQTASPLPSPPSNAPTPPRN